MQISKKLKKTQKKHGTLSEKPLAQTLKIQKSASLQYKENLLKTQTS